MSNAYQATKGNVKLFLQDLKNILNNPKSELNIIPREDKPMEYHSIMYVISLR